MSADITIRHCRLRLTRRGGWCWGPDPRALLRAAFKHLPLLIGERLAEMWPAHADANLVAPLRLRIALRLDELCALAVASDSASAGAAPVAMPDGLAQRFDAAVLELVRRAAGAVEDARTVMQPAATPPAPLIQRHATGVLAVLLDWRRRDILHMQLLQFSHAALWSWHAALLRTDPSPAGTSSASPGAALADLAVAWAGEALPLPAGERAALIRRIGMMTDAAGRCGVAPHDARVLRAANGHAAFDLPHHASSAFSLTDLERADTMASCLAKGDAIPVHRSASAAPSSFTRSIQADIKIDCVLPFLLLGPLSRSGYLGVLSAVAEAARLTDALPAFACALARKVLAPPRRGWLRDGAALTAAAAFAGLETPPQEQQLAELSAALAPLVSPLDASVAHSLTAGHRRGAGLLLQAAAPGWLLLDAEGLFAIAWCARIEQMFALLARFENELLLVPHGALEGDLLQRLDGAGFRFVTDARPGRHEDFRPLHCGPVSAWTNQRAAPRAPLEAAAAELEPMSADSAALWQALIEQRPSLPVGAAAAVERSLALAAALGLGTLAWTLWHEREIVTPLLALERFADLDGVVCLRADRVELRLPLGRRFFDLERGGLLAQVDDVPWFDGRPLRFVRG